ncbi:sce7726 family protein [Hymenobacter coccineus]|uniref:Sce7726 family protein n=1 Tax=Hymenobacter coccineus TaxID=1908235 RepID=A0A1G1TKU6_9BACT|nr:sce7726 family protein [Hymenobacter coccineus]OGX91496.1 hypothetical protein BEN49_04805 [Hymenobacter coccineus]
MKSFTRTQGQPTHHYALAQLFGSSLLNGIVKDDYESKLQALFAYCGLEVPNWSIANALAAAYAHLSRHYRCEYVYKNEIANQLLLARHRHNSATLLRELPSDRSIADIVIVNGITAAYEIKTELDNFDRLANQAADYLKLYDCLYVVTHEAAVPSLKQRLPPGVGLLVLSESMHLDEVRAAEVRDDLFDASKAVLTLRQSELVAAYEQLVGKLPPMGTASILSYCHSFYHALSKQEARNVFYEALKSRRPAAHQYQLLLDCEKSLKMSFLGRDLPKKLCRTVRTRLGLDPA